MPAYDYVEVCPASNGLTARRGYQVTYSVGWALDGREKAALRPTPQDAAVDGRGAVRERRASAACPDGRCCPRGCWTGEAHVTELTGLLCDGPGEDRLTA